MERRKYNKCCLSGSALYIYNLHEEKRKQITFTFNFSVSFKGDHIGICLVTSTI